MWGDLIDDYRIQSYVERGDHAMKHIFYLLLEDATLFSLLSNIYCASSRWRDVLNVRKLKK